ncbi:glycoside hydrolase family 79 protein, partial [Amylocystis lapponica]
MASLRAVLLHSLVFLSAVRANITVYNVNQQPFATATSISTSAGATYTGIGAYDPINLNPPPLPNPLPPTQFGIQLQNSAANVVGLSIPLSGTFYGFSIEMSVATQVTRSRSFIQVPFLNLMALIQARVGSVNIRVGGNTQDYAALVPSLADGKALEKQHVANQNPTNTPALLFTPELLYLMSNISALVNTKWYLGVPMNDTTNLRLAVAEYGERILGNNLLGLQIGNEPDLYARHGHRPSSYGPGDYFNEFGQIASAMQADSNIATSNNLIGPNIATGDWTPEDVWNTGFVSAYTNNLNMLTVEHYPDDNCAAIYAGMGTPKDPQTEFAQYLVHSAGKNTISAYLNSSSIAQAAGKPFVMFETNTASCGGFPGLSDSFGAALWALDYGLQMGYSNFSHALLHVGGQDVYYNPFTPPPTNQSSFHQWTIGPIFYSVLAVAETLGTSGAAQLIDLGANGGNDYTPGYAVYEGGSLARVALFNYMTDPSGASSYTATISVPGATPAQVQVKYLVAPAVGEKFNITWGGQTFGPVFGSDGRLQGTETVQTVSCDQGAGTCAVTVPAPGFALVSFAGAGLNGPSSTATFATTAATQRNTATVNPSVLATSNGHSGANRYLGSTSEGSAQGNGARGAGVVPGVVSLIAAAAGAALLMKGLSRQL